MGRVPTCIRTLRERASSARVCALMWAAASLPCTLPAAAQIVNFRNYTAIEGMPQAQVLAIHQDRAGYLWFGTYGGLSRYNGDAFTTYTTRHGLSGNTITALTEDANGLLVVGTGGAGVCFVTRGYDECLRAVDGLPDDDVRDLLLAPDGDVWVATERGVARIRGRNVVAYGASAGLPDEQVHALARDGTGRLWAATQRGLAYWSDGRFAPDTPSAISGEAVRAIVPTPYGLLVGTERGLFLRDGESSVQRIDLPPGDASFIADAAVDSAGIVWIATRGGALRFDGERVTHLTRRNGLLFDVVNRVMVDREGNVWFGTDAGASKLVPGPFTLLTESEGLPHSFVRAVAQDAAGSLWVGTRDGIALRDGDRLRPLQLGADMPDRRVYALAPLPHGGMLVGTRRGLLHIDGERRRLYLAEDGLPGDFVLAAVADSTGAWIGTDRGLARWENGKVRAAPEARLPADMAVVALELDSRGRLWIGGRAGGVYVIGPEGTRLLGPDQGMSDQTVWAFGEDAAGGVWVGTNGDGAYRISGDTVQRYTSAEGLVNDFVWQVQPDSRGGVWLFTSRGLDRYAHGRFEHYGRGDGLVDLEGAANAAWEDARGELWFGTGSGLVHFSPAREESNPVPPPILIEQITSDGERVAGDRPRTRFGDGVVQFHFASPSFRDEAAVRYRYRLLGVSTQWSQPTAQTSIGYASLAPGRYTFEVVALNDHGVPSAAPATAGITVVPAFWQTWWFRGLAIALGVALITAVFLLRGRRLEAERRRLEALVAQNTRSLAEKNARLESEIFEREAAESERRKLEAQLRQSQKLEAVGRLAGGIAHDFNNLLTSVVGNTELVSSELGEAHTLQPELREIRRAADRAASLVAQLLAFSRQQLIKRRVLDVNAVVTESSRMLQRLIGADIALELRLDPTLARVRADQSQLDQILINLALNARDAMPGGGTLTIGTRDIDLAEPLAQDENGDTVRGPCVLLTVTDTGCGMDPETRSRAFEPFFTTKEVGKGTGLGLSTVYGIVKQNGGQILVDSEPGRGSTFRIYLPRTEEQPTAEPTERAAAQPAVAGADRVVLVVEDEDAVRGLVCRTLRRYGYRILEAPDGPSALEISSRHPEPIHLLLSDMIMPGMSGKDVADRITALRRETNVLFMSGHTRDVLGSRGMLDESTDLIQKPFAPADLARRVREALPA
jgi:signal transduction histidine kinase/ligand-binding sensor domain-containing protein/CheY-like chemotaxis protein